MDKIDLKCGFCRRGKEVENICGKLWCNISEKVYAHQKCMQYSALLIQYRMKRFGGFKVKKVQKEINRGKNLRCSICCKKTKTKPVTGASSGCAINTCKKTFHYYCARTDTEACTQKIEYTDSDEGSTQVLYRVFCCKEHENKFCENLKDHKFADETDMEEYQTEPSGNSDNASSDSSSGHDNHLLKHKLKKNGIKQLNENYLSRKKKLIDKFKHEDLSDSEARIKKSKVNSDSSNETVYIVCFLESSKTPDSKSMQILKKCAWKLFGVHSDHVFLWQYDGITLTPNHVVHLLYDISTCLSQKNPKKLYQLMTQLNDQDIKKISDTMAEKMLHDTDQNFYIQLRKKIAMHLGSDGDNCVGKYCLVNALQEKYVGFIKLNDVTDPYKDIRKAFGATFEIHKKFKYEKWLPTTAKADKSTDQILDAQTESDILYEWITDNDIVYRQMHLFPTDEIIVCSDKQIAINRLKHRVQSEVVESTDGSEVVFIGRTQFNLLNFSEYAKRRIEKCVEDLLTFRHDVIVIADISSDSVSELRDLVFKLRTEIVCTAYTAADVAKFKLSCAILHFTLTK